MVVVGVTVPVVSAVLVFTPTTPYPLVDCVPEHSLSVAHWYFCTASFVALP